jgi:hypothetical protein
MNKTTYSPPAKATGDLVLQEVWRAKDTLSTAYGHDLDILFAETRKREPQSGHPLVNLQRQRKDLANGGKA